MAHKRPDPPETQITTGDCVFENAASRRDLRFRGIRALMGRCLKWWSLEACCMKSILVALPDGTRDRSSDFERFWAVSRSRDPAGAALCCSPGVSFRALCRARCVQISVQVFFPKKFAPRGVMVCQVSPGMRRVPGGKSFPLNGSLEAAVSSDTHVSSVQARIKPPAVSAQKASFR